MKEGIILYASLNSSEEEQDKTVIDGCTVLITLYCSVVNVQILHSTPIRYIPLPQEIGTGDLQVNYRLIYR